jgi:hypothetical protein
MCRLSIKCALSTPLMSDGQTILQAALPVHSVGRQYTHAVAYIVLIMARALPRKQPRDINTIWTTDIMVLGDLLGDTGIGYFDMYSLCFPPGPTCRGSAPCTCPP